MLNRSRLKRLWLRPFTQSRAGEDLYEWLTAVLLGSQRGMSHKWCLWFREHIVLCRRYARVRIPGRRIWLFEPGWSLAPVMLAHLVTEAGPLVTDSRRRLARRYVAGAAAEVARAAAKTLQAAGRSEAASPLLPRLNAANSPADVVAVCKAEYRVTGLPGLAELPGERADLCLSMGRLEHFAEPELAGLLAEMRRILSPGGVGSHIVDHRDHLWHFDKSHHCFHHLSYSDEDWARRARGRQLYRNRLLERDYLRLFAEAGFDVLARVHELHRSDASEVDPRTLWGRYRELSREDLAAAVSHFVVRRT